MVFPEPDGQADTPDGKLASIGCESPIAAIPAHGRSDQRHEGNTHPLAARLRPIIERHRALPNSGEIADKAFFDDLSDNL